MNLIPDIFGNGTPPQELYFLTPIANVPSILQKGILSHKRVEKIEHNDISNKEVQARRAEKIISNPAREKANKKALTIHQYANLYLRAHNAMMWVKVTESDGKNARGFDKYKLACDTEGTLVRDSLCVLRIDPRILTRNEVVVSTRNAAKNDAEFKNADNLRFSSESVAIQLEPRSIVFDDKKTPGKAEKRKAVRQAEVLIPYEIHPSYIRGIYVASDVARQKISTLFNSAVLVPVPVDSHPTLFYSNVEDWVNGGLNPLSKINPQPLANANYAELIEGSPESSDDEEFDEQQRKRARHVLGCSPKIAPERLSEVSRTPQIQPLAESSSVTLSTNSTQRLQTHDGHSPNPLQPTSPPRRPSGGSARQLFPHSDIKKDIKSVHE